MGKSFNKKPSNDDPQEGSSRGSSSRGKGKEKHKGKGKEVDRKDGAGGVTIREVHPEVEHASEPEQGTQEFNANAMSEALRIGFEAVDEDFKPWLRLMRNHMAHHPGAKFQPWFAGPAPQPPEE